MVTDLRTRRDPRRAFRARPIANFSKNPGAFRLVRVCAWSDRVCDYGLVWRVGAAIWVAGVLSRAGLPVTGEGVPGFQKSRYSR